MRSTASVGEDRPDKAAQRDALLRLLVRLSYVRELGKQFRLASGRLSDYYIECSLTTTNPAAMPLIGALIHDHVPARAVAIGGPTMGADPIAAAVAFHSAGTSRPIPWFSVRKAAKAHGGGGWIEGSAKRGEAVVVVEDVITSGGSLLDAVRKCQEEGLEVLRGVVLVDREEDGGRARVEETLARSGADFRALFTRTELEQAWQSGVGERQQAGARLHGDQRTDR